MAVPLTQFQTFLWGVAGALLGYVSLFVLPVLTAKAEGKRIEVNFPWMIVLAIVYIFGGGIFAMIIGDATAPKHAAFYGVGWEAAFKGAGEGTRLAVKASKR